MLGGCTSISDFGRLQPPLVADNIHSWVGQEAATRTGGPISLNNLTDDERTLRDLAFPLIQPPYDRIRWDAVLYEYGIKREFRRDLWVVDPTAYYRHLLAAGYRSTAGRYNQLNDDVRNDVVRTGPFFYLARRVIDADRKRLATMDILPDIAPPDRVNALARVGENNLTIAWVQASLAHRCAGTALRSIISSSPSLKRWQRKSISSLKLLQQQIAANQLVPPPAFAEVPVALAAQPALAIR